MLIDWLTLKIEEKYINPQVFYDLSNMHDRILRYEPITGHVEYETIAWESIRSDSHQLTMRCSGGYLHIQGSPARCFGDGDNTFSGGCVADLDINESAKLMIKTLCKIKDVFLFTNLKKWQLTRIDITENLFLSTADDVLTALHLLSNATGGKHRVSQTYTSSVYWNHTSQLKMGKAYQKGIQIKKMIQKKSYSGKLYEPMEIKFADNILRLEMSLKSQYWRERSSKHWTKYTSQDLQEHWNDYFEKVIGDTEMIDDTTLLENLRKTLTTRQVNSTYQFWSLMKAIGTIKARATISESTFYYHRKRLLNAGLSYSEINLAEVVQLKKKLIEAVPVNSWDELERLYQQSA